jgi:hypothetical protein
LRCFHKGSSRFAQNVAPAVIITGTIHPRGVASYLFADAAQPLPMSREALQSTAEMLVDPPKRPAAAR